MLSRRFRVHFWREISKGKAAYAQPFCFAGKYFRAVNGVKFSFFLNFGVNLRGINLKFLNLDEKFSFSVSWERALKREKNTRGYKKNG